MAIGGNMSKKKAALSTSNEMATKMAFEWSDEYLLEKTPEDLMRAYGCSIDTANHVLNNELTRRKLRR
jgi:hypothetical protein